ncbi:helix-turn-helix domain-containing protein [Scatolibacter rhodanostii]|uniref:helix-turn-helix domain-containing protein n=1 Tax=Scatolibacter rhodanostii TaxID=2014781 RepID=UPI0013564F36|nr:helix-turn-helix transcriptional regulator [Scatolibacter rhodanostii]
MNDLDFVTIGQRIKERRQALAVTQEAIANQLNVNPSHVSNIECGRANPSLTLLIKIANILECSVDFFIGGEYTFGVDKEKEKTLDDKIMDKLKYYDIDKKLKILKMLDIL